MKHLVNKIAAFIVIAFMGFLPLRAQYPADLWVVGNISDINWSSNKGVKCANLGEGKYQALVYRVMNESGDNTEKYYGNFRIVTSLSDGNVTYYGASTTNGGIPRFADGETKELQSSTTLNGTLDYSLPNTSGCYMLDIDLVNKTISVNSNYTPKQLFLIRNMSDGGPQYFASPLSIISSEQEYAGYELPMYYQVEGGLPRCYYYVAASIGTEWSCINAERYGLNSTAKHEEGTVAMFLGSESPLYTEKEGTYDIFFNRGTKELTIKLAHPDLYLVGDVNGMNWNQRGNGEKIKFVHETKCYYATIVPNVTSDETISFSFTSRAQGDTSDSDLHRYAGSESNQSIELDKNELCTADVHNVVASYSISSQYGGVPLYACINLDNKTMYLQTSPFDESELPIYSYNQVWSPDGKMGLIFTIDNGKPNYMVKSHDEWVINKSPLGLISDAVDYSQNLTYINAETKEINETYTLPSGKTSKYVNHCREMTIHTKTNAGQPFDIIFRVSNDGVAFRYAIPSQDGKSTIVIKDEASAVYPSNYKYILGQKFASKRNIPNFPYESYYGKYGVYGEFTDWNEAVSDASDPRFNSPIMIGSGNQHILISEAENIGTYSLSLLKAYQSPLGCIMWQHAGDAYQTHKEDHKNDLTVSLPLQTPWRTLQIGDLPTIFASTMQENLCKPTEMTDISWIEPGVASWDWGGVDGGSYSPLTRYEADKKYIDMAAKMGWKYVLVDGGWNGNDIQNTVNYANSKGIKVILWMTAKLADSTSFSTENMETTLRNWKQWGIDGVKIDFWEDDSRENMERMELLLKLTAKYKMNVNYHGCTRPSGLRRTYPHLLSYEGILGGENNFWSTTDFYMTSQHNVNSILTRNVVGPADYTPIDFAMVTGRFIQRYSFAQNLGLCVAYENGLLHVCESYQNLLPYGPSVILKRVPVAWDESRLLEGAVSQYVTIARRSGNDWWLSGITVSPRTANINLSELLPNGKTYTAYIYRDGDTRNKILVEKQTVTSATTLSIIEIDGGGFLVQLSENANLEMPIEETIYEAESSANELTGLSVNSDDALYTSGGKKVGNLGLGRKIAFKGINVPNDGIYAVTIYYSTKDNRNANYQVNGESLGNIEFPGSGKDNYSMANGSWLRRDVVFKAGADNTFTLIAPSDGWSPDIDRITVSAKQIADINTDIPENLYVIGAAFENQNWADSYTSGFKCYNAGNGIFYVNLWTNDVTSRNAFTFSSCLGDESTVFANRFGTCRGQTVLQPGTKSQFVALPSSGSFYFSLPKANTMYYATIDIKNGTISVREASESEYPDVLYFVHSTNAGSWNLTDASQPAVRNSNGEYVYKNIHIEKEGQYECGWYRFVASPTGTGCNIDNFYGSRMSDDEHFIYPDAEIKLNREFGIANSSFSFYGVYDIVLSTSDNRLYLSHTQSCPEELYLVGNVNYRTYQTAGNDLIKCYNAGNGIYYVTVNYESDTTDDGTFYFTINPDDATNTNFKYCGNVNDESIVMNDVTYCGSALLNTSACYKLGSTGKYYVTIDLKNCTLTLSDEPNVLYLVQNKAFDERLNCNWNLYDESKVLTRVAPLQYVAKGIELKPEKDTDRCYFNFTSIIPRFDGSLAWNTVKIDRWGYLETFVPEFLTKNLINDKEVFYNGPAGTYNIIVDLGVNTVLLYDAETEDYEGYKIRLVDGKAADTTYNGTLLYHGFENDGTEVHVADFEPTWNLGVVSNEWPQLLLEKDGMMLMHGKIYEDCISTTWREVSTDKSFTGRTYISPDFSYKGLILKNENDVLLLYMTTNPTVVDNVELDENIVISSGIGTITVTGVNKYTITSVGGISFTSGTSATSVAPGFYIVKAGDKTQKVIVK